MANLIDNFSETNQTLDRTLIPGGTDYAGQVFSVTNAKNLGSSVYYLKISAGSIGSATSYLYAVTGTAQNYKATGAVLATSNSIDVSTLTTSYQLIKFTFPVGQNYALQAGTKYEITIGYSGGSGGNQLLVGMGSLLGDNNDCTSSNGSTWSVGFFQDCFYIYDNSQGSFLGFF